VHPLRAADAFQQAIRIEPQDITSWNLLAQAYRSLKQPERAIRTLDNALRINRDSPMTYYLLGESFSDLKRPDRAVGFYEEAVQRNPKFGEAVYGLGVAYARLGRKTEFEAAVDLLKKLDPQAAQQLAAAQRGQRRLARALGNRQPVVGGNHRAVDETRGVGGEEQHEGVEMLRLADAPAGQHRDELASALGIPVVAVDLGDVAAEGNIDAVAPTRARATG
jgi:tetratricopeptide (TPR) repeat protein